MLCSAIASCVSLQLGAAEAQWFWLRPELEARDRAASLSGTKRYFGPMLPRMSFFTCHVSHVMIHAWPEERAIHVQWASHTGFHSPACLVSCMNPGTNKLVLLTHDSWHMTHDTWKMTFYVASASGAWITDIPYSAIVNRSSCTIVNTSWNNRLLDRDSNTGPFDLGPNVDHASRHIQWETKNLMLSTIIDEI
jgi:hypothetical protein